MAAIRRLAAILAADVAGYSRLMGATRWERCRHYATTVAPLIR
jgi:class 3 adenylate cyclase